MPETPPQGQPDEAMIDLLIKQVTEGLSSAEQRELDVLDNETASAYLRDFERAAAAVTLAGSTDAEPLPADLAQRIARRADEHFAAVSGGVSNVHSLDAVRDARPARGGAAGWWAAAACLVIAVFGWLRAPERETPAVSVVTPPPMTLPPPPVTPPPSPAPLTPAEQRAVLLAKSGTLKGTLNATKDPASKGVHGDVVWDPVAQKGFLHFVGLASNDPSVSEYQIWIFDGTRDQRYPVDGGVFDVPAGRDEVVIPIDAKLLVSKAAAFAVTVEKPGGAVVSSRQHVVALGTIS